MIQKKETREENKSKKNQIHLLQLFKCGSFDDDFVDRHLFYQTVC